MSKQITVTLRRTWTEQATITVEASGAFEAADKALASAMRGEVEWEPHSGGPIEAAHACVDA